MRPASLFALLWPPPRRDVGVFAARLLLLCACVAPAAGQPASSPANVFQRLLEQDAAADPIKYEGGHGRTKEAAVVVKGARTDREGVRAEYDWLRLHYPGFSRKSQALLRASDGKFYDMIEIEVPGDPSIKLYFDISEFYRPR